MAQIYREGKTGAKYFLGALKRMKITAGFNIYIKLLWIYHYSR